MSDIWQAMFDTLEADIVVMQETKIQRKDLRDDMVLVKGWDCYFSLPTYKKGPSLIDPDARISLNRCDRLFRGRRLHQTICLCARSSGGRGHGHSTAS